MIFKPGIALANETRKWGNVLPTTRPRGPLESELRLTLGTWESGAGGVHLSFQYTTETAVFTIPVTPVTLVHSEVSTDSAVTRIPCGWYGFDLLRFVSDVEKLVRREISECTLYDPDQIYEITFRATPDSDRVIVAARFTVAWEHHPDKNKIVGVRPYVGWEFAFDGLVQTLPEVARIGEVIQEYLEANHVHCDDPFRRIR